MTRLFGLILLLLPLLPVESAQAQEAPAGPRRSVGPKGAGKSPAAGPRAGGPGGRPGAGGARAGRGVAIGKNSGPGTAMGTTLLRGGRPGAAVASFRRQLEKEPDSVQAQVGLGRALAESGQCQEALIWLSGTIDTLPFSADAAIDAAACSLHLGSRSEALWYYDAGLRVDPDNVRLLSAKAMILAPSGDSPELLQTLDTLAYQQDTQRDASVYARMMIAADRGEIEDFDWYAWLWEHEGRSMLELRAVQARVWLDLDDPWSAAQLLEGRARRQQRATTKALRAEALRRTGNIGEAMYMLVERQGQARAMRAEAIRARVEVDNGDLDEATATLEPYEDLLDPEVLASLFYLARAKGDLVAAGRYAALYRRMETSELASLTQLTPHPSR